MLKGKGITKDTGTGQSQASELAYWAQRLQKERLERRQSQRRVAARAELSPTTVGNLEQGHGTMTSFLKAAAAIGVDPYDLMWFPVA